MRGIAAAAVEDQMADGLSGVFISNSPNKVWWRLAFLITYTHSLGSKVFPSHLI